LSELLQREDRGHLQSTGKERCPQAELPTCTCLASEHVVRVVKSTTNISSLTIKIRGQNTLQRIPSIPLHLRHTQTASWTLIRYTVSASLFSYILIDPYDRYRFHTNPQIGPRSSYGGIQRSASQVSRNGLWRYTWTIREPYSLDIVDSGNEGKSDWFSTFCLNSDNVT
jgi:hypothetical protein